MAAVKQFNTMMRLDLILSMRYIYINSNLDPVKKLEATAEMTRLKISSN